MLKKDIWILTFVMVLLKIFLLSVGVWLAWNEAVVGILQISEKYISFSESVFIILCYLVLFIAHNFKLEIKE